MNRFSDFLCGVLLSLLLALPAAAQGDYGFLWWAHGWRGASPEGARVLCVQTNHYGLAIDVGKPAMLHMGAIDKPKPYAVAVADPNAVVFDLPAAELSLWVEVDGVRYTCVRAAENTDDQANYPVRLIESGQVAQRFDIQQLVFQDSNGMPLSATGRLEVIAWPEVAYFLMEITPEVDLANARHGIRLGPSDGLTREVSSTANVKAGEPIQIALPWMPEMRAPSMAVQKTQVVVVDKRSGNTAPVHFDALRGVHNVALPESVWAWAEELDRQDRFSVRITNPSDHPVNVPLNFAIDGNVSGITGMTPVLLDGEGQPTGIPVQVSKNWHRQAGKSFLYEGPWFHGISQIEVPAGETWEGELAMIYAMWGGVPAVSHAQLCLVGWGTNQRWDQVAIGSWGEMITYDPDVNLNRSMIDDVRPLMVNGMGDNGKWQWTVNVGGGDFLVYFNAAGEKQYLSRMRAAYLEPGPNLTRTVYAGTTPDGCLDARIEVSSPRCDDVNRAFHKFRYDVRKPMAFSRLAFYQLGADNYNDHQFTTFARGDETGVLEEWPAEQGGKTYHRTGIPCAGEVPWFSLHGGIRNEHHPKGAWANRGLVIRKWKVRLGGVDIPQPTAAVYGTENGPPSANLELVPPPGCTELLPGDFVEAEVELLIVPAEPGTYYGPNAAFKEHLEANINTWKPVHRLAKADHLRIEATKGEVRRNYPVEIAVDGAGEAQFTIHGGAGYVPVTFTGLPTRSGFTLEGAGPDADDFAQVAFDSANGTWSRTYNVNLDDHVGVTLELRQSVP